VADRLMGRIAQESTPLPTAVEVLRYTGHVAPLGHQPADREAPVGLEIIHDPVVALHSRELLEDMGPMRGEVLPGAWRTQMPDDLARGNDA